MKLYAGLDLHSNNNVIVIVNESDQVVFRRRQANVASVILQSLEPFQAELAGVVVESTYNWYWLVDALMKAGYRVRLANRFTVELPEDQRARLRGSRADVSTSGTVDGHQRQSAGDEHAGGRTRAD
jgi:transposase